MKLVSLICAVLLFLVDSGKWRCWSGVFFLFVRLTLPRLIFNWKRFHVQVSSMWLFGKLEMCKSNKSRNFIASMMLYALSRRLIWFDKSPIMYLGLWLRQSPRGISKVLDTIQPEKQYIVHWRMSNDHDNSKGEQYWPIHSKMRNYYKRYEPVFSWAHYS